MNPQFVCNNLDRRNEILGQDQLNGIDYLEVASQDQKTLKVFFLHPLPGQPNPVPPLPAPELTAENIVIRGGVRVKPVKINSISVQNNVLTLTVNQAGDFSDYTLSLVLSPTQQSGPPPGFDPHLANLTFSFKVSCPSEFDCKNDPDCPPDLFSKPAINYLAKDYSSFRQLMLDRLSVLMPDWRERSPADFQVMLVEVMAYVGDYLSYYQDAVATEAYLELARKRPSVRRHARLLDYHVHEGCNARTWICLEIQNTNNQVLPKGTPFLVGGNPLGPVLNSADLQEAIQEKPVVFESLHDVSLRTAHNRVEFYTWSDSQCFLPKNSTRATLGNSGNLSFEPGDVVVFQEVKSPTTGTEADADPEKRHAVRLLSVQSATDPLTNTPVLNIEWHPEDRLPFPFCLTAVVENEQGIPELVASTVVFGNVVLADQGMSVRNQPLEPDRVPIREHYRPRLREAGITFSVAYDPNNTQSRPASQMLRQDPRQAIPEITVHDEEKNWVAQLDLLNSDRFAADFVVEMEKDRTATLRFGNDVFGRKPKAGSRFTADYRVGNGRRGNVGRNSVTRVVTSLQAISRVWNPLPGTGGTDRETMEEVRLYAPQAFKTQERAVTESDYETIALRHPEVQQALACFRWTGSWYTVFIVIDRKGGVPVQDDPLFREEMRVFFDRFRIAGYDLEIRGPVFVPLKIKLRVCVYPGYFKSDVKASLLEALSCRDLPDGSRGFFHPDNFTFGQPLYLSRVYEHAYQVEGVESVDVVVFQRWEDHGTLPVAKELKVSTEEILRLDNDANFPENGKIEFEMLGGL